MRADDGAPVVGLRARGLKDAAYEVDGGELRVTGLAPGPTRLTLEADGFAPRRLPGFELLPGEDRDLGRLELLPGTRLTVRVRDTTGKPLTGATVRLHGTLRPGWRLDELELAIGAHTRIDKSPRPGDYVEVRGRLDETGNVKVGRLRRR